MTQTMRARKPRFCLAPPPLLPLLASGMPAAAEARCTRPVTAGAVPLAPRAMWPQEAVVWSLGRSTLQLPVRASLGDRHLRREGVPD